MQLKKPFSAVKFSIGQFVEEKRVCILIDRVTAPTAPFKKLMRAAEVH